MPSCDPSEISSGLATPLLEAPVIEEGHWKDHAVHWDLIAPPLRPRAEDLAILSEAVSRLADEVPHRGPNVLILGVTQEYARFPWPKGTSLTAWERNESMIRHVWPGSRAETERVVQRDWLEPHDCEEKFDLVLGDGVLSQLAFPEQYLALVPVLESVTRPGGRWLLRLYARPTPCESLEHVLQEADSGRQTNINEFKLHLFMAFCGLQDLDEVAVADAWVVWDEARRTRPALRERWAPESRATIESYRDSPIRYSFPTVDAVVETFRPSAIVRAISYPGYPLGGSCPTLVLEPKG